jgi:hypothetical protein
VDENYTKDGRKALNTRAHARRRGRALSGLIPENDAKSPRLRSFAYDINSLGAWETRVETAFGAEALFDREFRFLAVSKAGRTLKARDGGELELPKDFFVGTRFVDLLPGKPSFLGDGRPGLSGLAERGFFSGEMVGLQLQMEMNLGFHFLKGTMEFWAVKTSDRGIVVHSKIHRDEAARPSIESPGVKIFAKSFI